MEDREQRQTPGETATTASEREEVRARVQSWLLSEGWQLTEKPHADATWLVEARDAGGRHVIVGQKKGREDQILLEGAVGIAERHREQLALLPLAERLDILWNLRFALLGLNVEFNGVEEPLTRVMIGQRIYFDGLTKDRFLQRISLVRNGIIAVIWSIARRLERPGAGEVGSTSEETGIN